MLLPFQEILSFSLLEYHEGNIISIRESVVMIVKEPILRRMTVLFTLLPLFHS